MKSTVEEKPKSEAEITFPVLMELIARDSEIKLVVCFESKTCGTVLCSKKSGYMEGFYFDKFTDCTRESRWKKFTGKITLEN